MQGVVFSISISPDAYLHYYRGSAKNILVKAEDGRRIQFPANALQPFITADGIHGRFRLFFDNNHKILKIESVTD